MNFLEILAKFDHNLRPFIVERFPKAGTFIYSRGRKVFLNMLASEPIDGRAEIPESYAKTLWDIKFKSPLFNAAGMFKYGDGYVTVQKQGAGAFLCGTSTAGYRSGNRKDKVVHPFISYPKSESASNWMGLPNYGHVDLARRVQSIVKKDGCPIGASISITPEDEGKVAINGLLDGLKLFQKTQADFIEVNESCPNVQHQSGKDAGNGLDQYLIDRLEAISTNFLKIREKNLPIIVKFSNDTDLELIPELIKILIDLGFDGVNFGNTSTDYKYVKSILNPKDKKAFDYFTENFGGGVSGSVLKNKSYNLCKVAADIIKQKDLKTEFHIIRTGGIQDYEDIKASEEIGVSLNQWYTGYFEAFAKYGNDIYLRMFE